MTFPTSSSKDISPQTFQPKRTAHGCHTAPQVSVLLSQAETLSSTVLLSYLVSKLALEFFGSQTDFSLPRFQSWRTVSLIPNSLRLSLANY